MYVGDTNVSFESIIYYGGYAVNNINIRRDNRLYIDSCVAKKIIEGIGDIGICKNILQCADGYVIS
jgi:hypothetical protein